MEMEKKVVLIGIGNCGNQVTYLGEQKYPELFDCVYINTSLTDLAMVSSDSLKYKIGDNEDYEVEGSGKDRAQMKKYLRTDIEELTENQALKDAITGKKYAFVICSAAGGTGSGAGPVFTSFMSTVFVNTNFVLVGVLPHQGASLMELGNTLEFLDEIYNHMDPSTTYMIYDNETRVDLPVTVGMTDVNENIIEDIRVITGIDNYPTQYESIDKADMETVVATPGRLLVARVDSCLLTEKNLEDGNLSDIVVKTIKKSAHAETDRNKKVTYWGIITYFNDAVNRLYTREMPGLEEFIGTPVEKFYHIAVNTNSEKLNFMHLIASGLSPINDRVIKIKDRVKELKEALADKAANKYVLSGEGIGDIVGDLRASKNIDTSKDQVTVDDVFSKFM